MTESKYKKRQNPRMKKHGRDKKKSIAMTMKGIPKAMARGIEEEMKGKK